jgi:hypothetical protein
MVVKFYTSIYYSFFQIVISIKYEYIDVLSIDGQMFGNIALTNSFLPTQN